MNTLSICLILSLVYYIRFATLFPINNKDTTLTEARYDLFIRTFTRQKADKNGLITPQQFKTVLDSQDEYWDTQPFKTFINRHSFPLTLNEFCLLMISYVNTQESTLSDARFHNHELIRQASVNSEMAGIQIQTDVPASSIDSIAQCQLNKNNEDFALSNEWPNIYPQEHAVQEPYGIEKITEHLQAVNSTEQFQTTQSNENLALPEAQMTDFYDHEYNVQNRINEYKMTEEQLQVTASIEEFRQLQNVENPALPDEWMNLRDQEYSIQELYEENKIIAEQLQMFNSVEQPQPIEDYNDAALPDEWMNLFDQDYAMQTPHEDNEKTTEQLQDIDSTDQLKIIQGTMEENPTLSDTGINFNYQEYNKQDLGDNTKISTEQGQAVFNSLEQFETFQNNEEENPTLSDTGIHFYYQEYNKQDLGGNTKISTEQSQAVFNSLEQFETFQNNEVPFEGELFKEVDANQVISPKDTSFSEHDVSLLPSEKPTRKRRLAEVHMPKQPEDSVDEHGNPVVPAKKPRRKSLSKIIVTDTNTPVSEPSISGSPATKPRKRSRKCSPKVDVSASSTGEYSTGTQAELSVNNKSSSKTSSEHVIQSHLFNEQEGKSNLKLANSGAQLFQRYLILMASKKNSDAQNVPSADIHPFVTTSLPSSDLIFNTYPRQPEG
ncbi:uncharacterized protein LOC126838669 isoform X4 [Adelges cooleyi]|uniref:uncharacterized protein LOC126838669 isoform X3 n=1 Tax=Adelges cooleyi TaxID=133065 RepID=UPI00218096B0|nr:uncharacterized protein LOC126838669 isoform X3 [Adelges cooleyi]XP_050429235.1 uncharacterized protein LOC126838669 isoform X4 [Adelges cooleyi]